MYTRAKTELAELDDELEVMAGALDSVAGELQRAEATIGYMKGVIEDLERENDAEKESKRSSNTSTSVHNAASDIATLGHLQRDLGDILMEMRYLETRVEPEGTAELRGGMGGELEDEIHVCGDGEYKCWDHESEFTNEDGAGHEGREKRIQRVRNTIEELGQEVERRQAQSAMLRKRKSMEQEEGAALRSSSMRTAPGIYKDNIPSECSSHHNDPTMRGGSSCQPFDSWNFKADNIEAIYEDMMRVVSELCGQSPPSACIPAWTSIASTLYMRGKHLERELKEYKLINDNLVKDLMWTINKLGELEEALEKERAVKVSALVDLGFAKRKLQITEGKEVKKAATTLVAKQSTKGKEGAVSPVPTTKASEPSKHTSVHSSTKKAKRTAKTTKSDDPSTWKKAIDYFLYFPRKAEILFPGSPQPLFHFTGAHDLDQIRRTLDYRHDNGMATDPYEIRIREIMIAREDKGVPLPDELEEDFICIDIPIGPAQEPIEVAAWIANEEADDACLRVHEIHQKDHFSPSKGNAQVHVRKFGNEFNSLDHIIDMALDTRAPFDCSCAKSLPKNPFETYVPPCMVSVRGGGDNDDYDDYDDYDDDGPADDSDDEDDEVSYEDEANDPWDSYGEYTTFSRYFPSSRRQMNKSRSCVLKSRPGVVFEEAVGLRGGADDDGISERRVNSWLDPKTAPLHVELPEASTPSAKSIHVFSRLVKDGGRVRPMRVLTPSAGSQKSTSGGRKSIMQRLKRILAALVRYMKHLLTLTKQLSGKTRAVFMPKAGALVSTPPQQSHDQWQTASTPMFEQDMKMRQYSRPISVNYAEQHASQSSNTPHLTGFSSSWSTDSASSSLALPSPTPPRKDTPPLPARNPRRDSQLSARSVKAQSEPEPHEYEGET